MNDKGHGENETAVGCDCAAQLRALNGKVDALVEAIGGYQTHLGDVHSNIIGDLLDIRMKHATLANSIKTVGTQQVTLTEAVCDLVTSNGDVTTELHEIADAALGALDGDEADAEGERPA